MVYPIRVLLVLRTRNNTIGAKLVIFPRITLYYGNTYILCTVFHLYVCNCSVYTIHLYTFATSIDRDSCKLTRWLSFNISSQETNFQTRKVHRRVQYHLKLSLGQTRKFRMPSTVGEVKRRPYKQYSPKERAKIGKYVHFQPW